MAENTRVPLNRIERVLAYVLGSIAGLSILSIVAIFVGRSTGVSFAQGVWPAVVVLPSIGLPITLLVLIAFLILLTVRRTRLARNAGE